MRMPAATGAVAAISRASARCAPTRPRTDLGEGEGEGQGEREMAEFGDHDGAPSAAVPCPASACSRLAAGGAPPSFGFQWPVFFSASATSGGM